MKERSAGAPRWLVGQLGGGVGTLAALGPAGLAVRRSFCADLGLGDPVISWLATRDRIAEFGGVLAMITGTLARFGTEVYQLQRPEIGELGEPRPDSVIGSITMHHKRNPEGSEHLATLARLVRVNAGVLMEGLVGEHERDGRTWKSEWPALPEVCLLTTQALQLAISLAEDLRCTRTVWRPIWPPISARRRTLPTRVPRRKSSTWSSRGPGMRVSRRRSGGHEARPGRQARPVPAGSTPDTAHARPPPPGWPARELNGSTPHLRWSAAPCTSRGAASTTRRQTSGTAPCWN